MHAIRAVAAFAVQRADCFCNLPVELRQQDICLTEFRRLLKTVLFRWDSAHCDCFVLIAPCISTLTYLLTFVSGNWEGKRWRRHYMGCFSPTKSIINLLTLWGTQLGQPEAEIEKPGVPWLTPLRNTSIMYTSTCVQRILEREERSRECDVIVAAVESMKTVAAHINEMKARHEQVVRTQEISSVLHNWHGPDLSTVGHVLLEVSATALHHRQFVIIIIMNSIIVGWVYRFKTELECIECE